MARNIFNIAIALAALMGLGACYHEVNLDGYRDSEGENLLTLNSLVCPDTTIRVSATRPYFFSDVHNYREFVMDLELELSINGKSKGMMKYDFLNNVYISDVKPAPGDTVQLSTTFRGNHIEASDVVPQPVEIKNIKVSREGPYVIYSDYDFVINYTVTFTDTPGHADYYFLQWDHSDARYDIMNGERDYTHAYVFNTMADEIRSTLPGWEPYSPYGLPFSDKGIDGQTHDIMVRETVQMNEYSYNWKLNRMCRRFKLFAISKHYYDYLISVLINDTDDRGLQGGMIDLGMADPVKIHSNISGGVGILGCYTTPTKEFDVLEIVGKFPRK